MLDDDPVIDYMIMEALAAKDAKAEEELRKAEELKAWKKDKTDLHRAVN